MKNLKAIVQSPDILDVEAAENDDTFENKDFEDHDEDGRDVDYVGVSNTIIPDESEQFSGEPITPQTNVDFSEAFKIINLDDEDYSENFIREQTAAIPEISIESSSVASTTSTSSTTQKLTTEFIGIQEINSEAENERGSIRNDCKLFI